MDEYRHHASGVWAFDLLNVFNLRTVITLARLMRRLQCQIVHTHLWTADVLGSLAAALARVPVSVSTVHGEYFRVIQEHRLRRARKLALSRTYRAVYHLFDGVIAVSPSVAEDLVHRAGLRIDPGRVTTIQNGIDFSFALRPSSAADRQSLGIAPTARVVVTVANFVPIKGHRWLVEAMPRIVQRYPEAMFVLAGAGEELPTIRRLVEAHGLDRHVRFAGARLDAPELMAMSDVVVVPSLSEGSPLVVLEALALARPVVATRVGGIPQIIEDGQAGLLVPPGDPVALADAILTLLSHPALARRLGKAGRESVLARYSAETMVRQTERLYLDLATAKGLGRHDDG